jgi:hypothetical protein
MRHVQHGPKKPARAHETSMGMSMGHDVGAVVCMGALMIAWHAIGLV